MAQKSHAREYMEKFRGIALVNTIGKDPGDPKSKLRKLADDMKDASLEYSMSIGQHATTDFYLFEDQSVLNLEWDAFNGQAIVTLTEKATMRLD